MSRRKGERIPRTNERDCAASCNSSGAFSSGSSFGMSRISIAATCKAARIMRITKPTSPLIALSLACQSIGPIVRALCGGVGSGITPSSVSRPYLRPRDRVADLACSPSQAAIAAVAFPLRLRERVCWGRRQMDKRAAERPARERLRYTSAK